MFCQEKQMLDLKLIRSSQFLLTLIWNRRGLASDLSKSSQKFVCQRSCWCFRFIFALRDLQCGRLTNCLLLFRRGRGTPKDCVALAALLFLLFWLLLLLSFQFPTRAAIFFMPNNFTAQTWLLHHLAPPSTRQLPPLAATVCCIVLCCGQILMSASYPPHLQP